LLGGVAPAALHLDMGQAFAMVGVAVAEQAVVEIDRRHAQQIGVAQDSVSRGGIQQDSSAVGTFHHDSGVVPEDAAAGSSAQEANGKTCRQLITSVGLMETRL
jgi:hypothetical protein